MSEAERITEELKEGENGDAIRVVLDPASFTVRATIRVVVVTLILLSIFGFLQSVIGSLTLLAFLCTLSVFFAYLIDPLVKLIREPFKKAGMERVMPRSLAIFISYIAIFGILGFGIANLTPLVVEQGKEFGNAIPGYATSVQKGLNDLNRRFQRLRLHPDVQTTITDQARIASEKVTTGFGNFLINTVMYVPWLLIVPVFSFFFLKDIDHFRRGFLLLFPAGVWRSRASAVLEDANKTLAAYTRAQLLSCLLIGAVCVVGFYLLGHKYALLLGILAGIFEFIPMLGPLTIGILATTTAAFGDDPWRALYISVFLIVLRVVHDYVTYPRIIRGGMRLHPLVVILSVLAGEQAAGIPGVFLAVPVVALMTVIYKHIVDHRKREGLWSEAILEMKMPEPPPAPASES